MIGLTNLPLRAAFISAYNAGLMPFFLHFFKSASVKWLASKLLAFQSLLDCDIRDVLVELEGERYTPEGCPEADPDELVRVDC